MSDALKALRERAAAVKAAQEAGAVTGQATATTSAGEGLSNVKTGLQGSNESAGATIEPPLPEVHDEPDADKAAKSVVYKDTGLKKFFLPLGQIVKPEYGFFYAVEAEEIEMLEHYASVGKVVKLLK